MRFEQPLLLLLIEAYPGRAETTLPWGQEVNELLGLIFLFFNFEALSCKACKEWASHVDKELYFRWGCPSFVSILDPFANFCKVCECPVTGIGGKSGLPNGSILYCGLHGGSPCRPLTFNWSTHSTWSQ